jgi:hypothetical protein
MNGQSRDWRFCFSGPSLRLNSFVRNTYEQPTASQDFSATAPTNCLESTLAKPLRSADSNELTEKLSYLESTLMKNGGEGASLDTDREPARRSSLEHSCRRGLDSRIDPSSSPIGISTTVPLTLPVPKSILDEYGASTLIPSGESWAKGSARYVCTNTVQVHGASYLTSP